jgi:hypothetical protein
MVIIGVDFHPEFQQIASVDTDTGEFQEKRLAHRAEAERFYRALAGQKVRVGMEASGDARWFERLLAELQLELWIGDAAEIRTKRVRKQKADRQDARLILQLLLEERFPQIWVPSWENRDLRQLLWHRHRMTSFPEAHGKWQISTAGGNQPKWRSDGKELFYLSADGKMMAVPVKTGANFDAGSPTELFQADPREMVATSEEFSYAVSNDGQKFLINTQVKTAQTPMSIVLNWNSKSGK